MIAILFLSGVLEWDGRTQHGDTATAVAAL
jgi:hypothetical protein